jgi:hypothetical protein
MAIDVWRTRSWGRRIFRGRHAPLGAYGDLPAIFPFRLGTPNHFSPAAKHKADLTCMGMSVIGTQGPSTRAAADCCVFLLYPRRWRSANVPRTKHYTKLAPVVNHTDEVVDYLHTHLNTLVLHISNTTLPRRTGQLSPSWLDYSRVWASAWGWVSALHLLRHRRRAAQRRSYDRPPRRQHS